MLDEKVSRALRALGRDTEIQAIELPGSMSEAAVYRIRTNGHDAVLKVTGAEEEQGLARHELVFYQTLAAQVPIRTPRLLDFVDTDELTALVLTAHSPTPPAPEWNDGAWLDLTRQLAELHAFPAPAGPPWNGTPWLQHVLDDPPLENAQAFWSHTAAGASVDIILDNAGALAAGLAAVPSCFIHGDCHVGNLLQEDQHVVWADWAVTGYGYPAVDLAFLYGRAHADSAQPPYHAMLDEYATHRGVDRDQFRRSMLAAELVAMLFGWPNYSQYHSRAERDRTTQHLIHRIDDWQAQTT